MADYSLTMYVYPEDLGYYILTGLWQTDNKFNYYSISKLKKLIEEHVEGWDWVKIEFLIRKCVRHRWAQTKIIPRTVSKITFIRNPLKFKLAKQTEPLFAKTWPKNMKMDI